MLSCLSIGAFEHRISLTSTPEFQMKQKCNRYIINAYRSMSYNRYASVIYLSHAFYTMIATIK